MSSEEDLSRGMSHYLNVRKGIKYISQGHFLSLVEDPDITIKSSPSRTIEQVYMSDYPDLIYAIRRFYVPNYNLYEADMFTQAVSWVLSNYSEFSSAIDSNSIEMLPAEVALNFR